MSIFGLKFQLQITLFLQIASFIYAGYSAINTNFISGDYTFHIFLIDNWYLIIPHLALFCFLCYLIILPLFKYRETDTESILYTSLSLAFIALFLFLNIQMTKLYMEHNDAFHLEQKIESLEKQGYVLYYQRDGESYLQNKLNDCSNYIALDKKGGTTSTASNAEVSLCKI
tara:strand:+ start:491 stop:1003 length:513 start_codon:yes stop_codon:yes gene_type:complete